MANGPLILTIDDDAQIRTSFRLYLEDFDYRVIEATDGITGIECFRQKKPDLVLLDLRMPKLDGLDVLKIIRKEAPDLPIVMVSGTGVISDVVTAIDLGAWSYLLKPVTDLSILLHTVEKELGKARLIRENREYRHQLEAMVSLRTSQLETAYFKLERNYAQIIHSLARAATFRDNNTSSHVVRVSKYAHLIAKEYGLPEKAVELIELGSLMHDIGKIGTPDKILFKTSNLNNDEWLQMKKHCTIGVNILGLATEENIESYSSENLSLKSNSADPESVLFIARTIAAYHHEHWDGKGYPEGLKGERIPIEARIVSLADTYDALSSNRSYKSAFDEAECQQIIYDEAGKSLDPNLVKLFFANIDTILEIKSTWID